VLVLALAALAALSAGLVAPGAEAAPKLPTSNLVQGDFETGDLGQWSGVARVRARSITVVRSPVRQGRYAARFEVRRGDNPIGYGDRAQIQIGTNETEGALRWYAWSTRVAPSFPRYWNWQVLAQWHAKASGSPPIAFMAERDDLVLRVHRHRAPGSVIDVRDIWRGPLRRGAWRDIAMRVRWSGSDRRGWVELWIDGTRQRFDDGSLRRRIRTMYPGVGNYFTLGYYRQSGLSRPGIVFHDGFRMTRG
jgi:Polysaccharide lyase